MSRFTSDDLTVLAYELPDEVLKYKLCGDFASAFAAIERWLERPVSEGLKKRLSLEKSILEQLPAEFPYTEKQVIALFQEQIPDFEKKDLERLDREGLAEWIFLDGEKHYIHNIFRNVTQKDPEIIKRAGIQTDDAREKELLNAAIRELKEKGSVSWRFRLHTSIRLKNELFYPGIQLKAHLPLPAELHQISDVRLLDHSSGKVTVDPANSLYRTICFEDTLEENREFFAEYEYTVNAVYQTLSDTEPSEPSGNIPEHLKAYTEEQAPHIRFSPYLRSLAAEIVGEETRPLQMARRIYDYITTKVHYSFMREYFLIPDIPQYCARNLRGDCGVQSLLFITLCRICNIPAKWQSGLYALPGYVGPHDWAMFWTKSHGWLFADPSFGGSAFRDGDEERRRFYFGNLDPYRMAANNAFQQKFSCEKQFKAIDPYDNQSGELESDRRGYQSREIETQKILLSAKPL